VAFEYAEFRDLATDLNVGDPYLAPLEYLFHVRPDDEHNEFSWLVARVLYGDLRGVAGAAEAQAAEELGASLRRRLLRGQPVTSRLLAFLSRASLEQPYSTELPNVRSYHPLRHLKANVRAHLHLPRRRTLRRLQPWSVR
jgi:hypothetical protein